MNLLTCPSNIGEEMDGAGSGHTLEPVASSSWVADISFLLKSRCVCVASISCDSDSVWSAVSPGINAGAAHAHDIEDGCVVGAVGAAEDPERLQGLKNMSSPRTVGDVWQFKSSVGWIITTGNGTHETIFYRLMRRYRLMR